MAAERLVRGPVDREDGLAKTFPSDNVSLRFLGMSPGSFVWLYNPSSSRDLFRLLISRGQPHPKYKANSARMSHISAWERDPIISR